MRNNSNYRTSMRYGDRDIGGDALQRELDENARIAQEAQDPNSERNKRLQEERELANDNYTYHQDILKNIQSIGENGAIHHERIQKIRLSSDDGYAQDELDALASMIRTYAQISPVTGDTLRSYLQLAYGEDTSDISPDTLEDVINDMYAGGEGDIDGIIYPVLESIDMSRRFGDVSDIIGDYGVYLTNKKLAVEFMHTAVKKAIHEGGNMERCISNIVKLVGGNPEILEKIIDSDVLDGMIEIDGNLESSIRIFNLLTKGIGEISPEVAKSISRLEYIWEHEKLGEDQMKEEIRMIAPHLTNTLIKHLLYTHIGWYVQEDEERERQNKIEARRKAIQRMVDAIMNTGTGDRLAIERIITLGSIHL